MQIIQIDRRNNQVADMVFTSFKEVFDYCEDMLYGIHSRMDDIMFGFRIVDSGEVFSIFACGSPDGYKLREEIQFIGEIK